MNYQEYEARENIKWEKKRTEAQKEADIAYNRGLWKGLSFWNKWMYPLLARPIGDGDDLQNH